MLSVVLFSGHAVFSMYARGHNLVTAVPQQQYMSKEDESDESVDATSHVELFEQREQNQSWAQKVGDFTNAACCICVYPWVIMLAAMTQPGDVVDEAIHAAIDKKMK